jgi:pimeloyl-ACP methyl ester carboxylesterase
MLSDPPRPTSMLDRLYARFLARPLFSAGWGSAAALERLRSRPPWQHDGRVAALKWHDCERVGDVECQLGSFDTPAEGLSGPSARAWVQWLRPRSGTAPRPEPAGRRLVIVAGGSGEQGFTVRQRLWSPLVADGCEFLFLETAWHGLRCPAGFRGIPTVADQLLMNVSTALELQSLAAWARDEGFDDLTLAGYSMGAFMAGIAACHLRWSVRCLLVGIGTTPVPAYIGPLHVHKIDLKALGAQHGQSAAWAAAELSELLAGADLGRHPRPCWPSGVHLVAGRDDLYLPLPGAEQLHSHWPESTLEVLHTDHIGLVLWQRRRLQDALRKLLMRDRPR